MEDLTKTRPAKVASDSAVTKLSVFTQLDFTPRQDSQNVGALPELASAKPGANSGLFRRTPEPRLNRDERNSTGQSAHQRVVFWPVKPYNIRSILSRATAARFLESRAGAVADLHRLPGQAEITGV
ncbi:hypothetical protein CIRG_05051 [Coccidioides immitis RMSCC 2394]|uniref:Uncharacterized protein n=1 Tax=Coccidioides immitis RMSCC 2394 TaxID=404692 RepID=A0A0J6YE93_COCIT|nr:hypothetical protein CIRG_05051 [Coccidioides immitis RMSCC 2394]